MLIYVSVVKIILKHDDDLISEYVRVSCEMIADRTLGLVFRIGAEMNDDDDDLMWETLHGVLGP